jgi:hypothetical protein
MIHFFKFRQDLFDPQPARDVYVKRKPGRGWPEECPPLRAANAFGFDLLANFDLTFVRGRAGWRLAEPVSVESDFLWAPPGSDDEASTKPLEQEYAWFWDRGQVLPHPISDSVYEEIQHQVKVSTFLYLRTDPNECLLLTDLPNQPRARPWRAVSALVETDWYPASYPWHCVLELDPDAKRVTIARGEPLCRVVPVRRDTYFAQPMTPAEFDDFFARGQRWLATHGRAAQHDELAHVQPAKPAKGRSRAKAPEPGTLDITRTYSRQQARSKFVVVT